MNIEKISPLSNTVSIYFARPAAGQTEEFLSGHLGPARHNPHTTQAKTATVFAAESVSLYGNEVNTHEAVCQNGNSLGSRERFSIWE